MYAWTEKDDLRKPSPVSEVIQGLRIIPHHYECVNKEAGTVLSW
jgi:hypothetical protein